MLHLINAAMHVDGRFGRGKCGVEVGLANIATEPVYGFQRRGGIDTERVWPNTDDGAVLLMGAVVCEVAGTPVCIVGQVDVGYAGKRWAWVACERVQGQAVEYYGEDLGVLVVIDWMFDGVRRASAPRLGTLGGAAGS
jgi:hypothetical protein